MPEQVFLSSPIPATGRRVIASPFQFLVTGEDNLRIRVWNSHDPMELFLTGRLLGDDGVPKPLTQRLVPTADRLVNTALLSLGTGYVLNVTVETQFNTVRVGQCYVALELVRGFAGALTSLGTLAAGYVAAANPLTWPGAAVEGPLDGPGYVRPIVGTAPGAGVELFETVPLHARWSLLSWYATLLTSAVVANRTVFLVADDAIPQPRFTSQSTYTQAAGQFVPYYWLPGMPGQAITFVNTAMAALPWPNKLTEGVTLRTATVNRQAGDQWSAPTYVVEEWLDIWGA